MSCALAHYESLQFVVINNRCRLYFWPRRNGLFLVSSSLCYEHLRFFTRQWFHLHLRFRTLGGSRSDPVKRTRQRALSTTDSSRYHCCWHLLASAVDVASRISSQRSSAPGACYWLHLARRWREFIAQNGCRVLFPQRSSSHGGTQGRGVGRLTSKAGRHWGLTGVHGADRGCCLLPSDTVNWPKFANNNMSDVVSQLFENLITC